MNKTKTLLLLPPVILSITAWRILASCYIKKDKTLKALSLLANYAWGFLDE